MTLRLSPAYHRHSAPHMIEKSRSADDALCVFSEEGAAMPAQVAVAIEALSACQLLARHHLDFTTCIIDLLQHQFSFIRQTALLLPAFFIPHRFRTTHSHTKYFCFEHNRILTILYTPSRQWSYTHVGLAQPGKPPSRK